MVIKRKIKTLINTIKYSLLEKNFNVEEGCTKYLLYRKKKYNSLLICFSAFPPGEKPLYNYVNSLSSLQMDRIYICDSWGYRASYYLYENGAQTPMLVTRN